jgi:hypothetical protein
MKPFVALKYLYLYISLYTYGYSTETISFSHDSYMYHIVIERYNNVVITSVETRGYYIIALFYWHKRACRLSLLCAHPFILRAPFVFSIEHPLFRKRLPSGSFMLAAVAEWREVVAFRGGASIVGIVLSCSRFLGHPLFS